MNIFETNLYIIELLFNFLLSINCPVVNPTKHKILFSLFMLVRRRDRHT